MKNEQVAEAWNWGKPGSGSNFYTDGRTIWSYGEHFPVATKKYGVIYFNDDPYSMTTAIHKSKVAHVLSGLSLTEFRRQYKELRSTGTTNAEIIRFTDTEGINRVLQEMKGVEE